MLYLHRKIPVSIYFSNFSFSANFNFNFYSINFLTIGIINENKTY